MAQQTEEKPIVLDFAGLTESLKESNRDQLKQIMEALKPAVSEAGKGHVMPAAQSQKLIESLQKVAEQGWKLEEQWTIVIPNYRQKELHASLRDYVYVNEVMKTEPGDVLNYIRQSTSSIIVD